MSPIALVLAGVFAASAGLLAWFAIDFAVTAATRYRETFTRQAHFHLSDMFLFVDPGKLLLANVAVMGIGALVVLAITGSTVFSIAAFLLLGFLPHLLFARMRKRRLARFEQQLPDALMMLAGGLRAGVSLSTAIQQLVAESRPPLSQEFSLMLREQRLGVSLEDSLGHLARRVPTPTVTLVVSAMRIASETGGGLAETLERTAATIRSAFQIEGKIDALTAQGKLQAWVVGALPLLLMAVLNRMEPEAMGMLWHTQVGWATLVVIGFLEGMGIYLIRRIVAIDV